MHGTRKGLRRHRGPGGRTTTNLLVSAWAGCAGLATLLAGCGESVGDGDPTIPPLDLVEELRLGVVDEPAHEQFGRVAGVAVPDSDELWLLDRSVPELRRFAPDGSFLGSSGGRGEGPGEFQSPTAIVPDGADGVVVWDPGNSRLSWFDGEGDFVRSAPVPSGLVGGGWPLLADTLGRVHVLAANITSEWDGQGRFPTTRIRIGPDGTVQDSVAVPPAETSDGPDFVIQTSDGSVRPFPVETHGILDIGGEPLFGRSDRYRIVRGTPEAPGDTLIRLDWERLELSDEEREQFEAWQRYFRRESGPESTALGPLPSQKPVFHYFRRDIDGRIWIRIHVDATLIDDPVDPAEREPDESPPLNYRERTVYHLWTPEGQPVGEVTLPRGARLLDARGDRIWVSESGPVGEPQVVRYRLSEG